MIPIRLKLSGFLSYRDPVDVDFTSFDLACISGENGAGKSSLLDAITWVLFGQARKTGDVLIHSAANAAEVTFIFGYEQNFYRVQRILPRGKTTVLEFQIADGGSLTVDRPLSTVNGQVKWRPLTEATIRATQARIESILHLDYDTFINASFFLQGKADQFTQQKASERKRILGSILGLELWEVYRERTAERRKMLEDEVKTIDGRLAEINAELGEESARKGRLKELEAELARLKETRKAQETVMSTIKQAIESLERQREMVEKLDGQIRRGMTDLNNLRARQAERETERERFAGVVSRAEVVEKAHQDWKTARAGLEDWNALAEKFREQEKVRQEPLAKIGAEQARLEHERDSLRRRADEKEAQTGRLSELEQQLAEVQKALAELDARLKVRSQLEQSQGIVARFREQAKLRQAPLTEISAEKARLEQELKTLEKQREAVETQQSALKTLQVELEDAQGQLNQAEALLARRNELEQAAKSKKERQFELRSGNERLKLEMESLDERIKKLEVAEGAVCPLCGQPLSALERQKLVNDLRSEGKGKGDEFRKNKSELESMAKEIAALEKEITGFGRIEKDHLFHVTAATKINERMDANRLAVAAWKEKDAPRLVEIRETLKAESFSPHARQHLARIERELEAIGKALGVKAAKGKSIFDIVEEKVLEIEAELNTLKGFDDERLRHNTRSAQLSEQISALRSAIEDWNKNGQPRLAEIEEMLKTGHFSLAERQKLAEIDEHLKSLGYDATAHDAVRQAEQAGRSSESDLRELEAARAALMPLEREILEMQGQSQARQTELEALKSEHEAARKTLDDLAARTPNLHEAERALWDAQERENIVTQQVGAARQKVTVLEDQRARKKDFESHRDELAGEIGRHKTLERAFSKDGVPALLIEQALPQIEEKANELLDRLSNGAMSVRFVTQAEYKDKKREDMKETLDIQISDGAGSRDYEMFSGGEAFRVNFAIRLALSEVLARRTGARLQTLVIDEGFGSQDAQGRQRLVEAINQVKGDFAKILIITHLEELKDAFPNRIEVEKTAGGSRVRVV